ncbi:MAG: cupin domain-containing protein [Chloroflexia bacterium]
MATRGDEFINAAGGQRLTVRQTAADTGGALLQMEAVYAPGGKPPPIHAHPAQEERFSMLAGAMLVRIAGREHRLAAGAVLIIPAGTPHTMWNDGNGEARFRWEVRPALRSESFFAYLYALVGRGGRPPLLALAALFYAYRDEFRVTGMAHRLLFGALGVLARVRGTDFREAIQPSLQMQAAGEDESKDADAGLSIAS